MSRSSARRAVGQFGGWGRWWPLWSILGGAAIAMLTVVLMRYVG